MYVRYLGFIISTQCILTNFFIWYSEYMQKTSVYKANVKSLHGVYIDSNSQSSIVFCLHMLLRLK